MMGEGFDLAAVAGMAGLGGSAIAGVGALIFFKGFLMRILTQVIVTAALTFVGFIALLNFLGFEIVPKDGVSSAMVSPQGAENFSAQSAPAAAPDDGKRTYAVKSPWSRS
jgi:hypothetical protein